MLCSIVAVVSIEHFENNVFEFHHHARVMKLTLHHAAFKFLVTRQVFCELRREFAIDVEREVIVSGDDVNLVPLAAMNAFFL